MAPSLSFTHPMLRTPAYVRSDPTPSSLYFPSLIPFQLDPSGLIQAIRQPAFIVYTVINALALILLSLLSRSPRWGGRFIGIDVGVCALYGGYTVLSTKALSSLLSTMFLSAFRFWISWILVGILVGTSVLQIKYLNKALMRYESKVGDRSANGRPECRADNRCQEVIPTQFVFFSLAGESYFRSGRLLTSSSHCRLRRTLPGVSWGRLLPLRQLCLWRKPSAPHVTFNTNAFLDRDNLHRRPPAHFLLIPIATHRRGRQPRSTPNPIQTERTTTSYIFRITQPPSPNIRLRTHATPHTCSFFFPKAISYSCDCTGRIWEDTVEQKVIDG